jgi:hypothetical protein
LQVPRANFARRTRRSHPKTLRRRSVARAPSSLRCPGSHHVRDRGGHFR